MWYRTVSITSQSNSGHSRKCVSQEEFDMAAVHYPDRAHCTMQQGTATFKTACGELQRAVRGWGDSRDKLTALPSRAARWGKGEYIEQSNGNYYHQMLTETCIYFHSVITSDRDTTGPSFKVSISLYLPRGLTICLTGIQHSEVSSWHKICKMNSATWLYNRVLRNLELGILSQFYLLPILTTYSPNIYLNVIFQPPS